MRVHYTTLKFRISRTAEHVDQTYRRDAAMIWLGKIPENARTMRQDNDKNSPCARGAGALP